MGEPAANRYESLDQIRTGLLGWFRAHARDLPWRRTRDPYAILVSEIMLQQTQVDRVIPYYERFLTKFPTVESLSAAPTAEVIRLWSGLGYNRRAVNLQRAARAVMEQFGGTFPADPESLRQLPGVGAYTAGAVAAFAFEQDVAFMDTNMRRVLNRLLFGSAAASERELLDVAQTLLPPGKGWEWNQALIEFGALHCTARKPVCVLCPLQDTCAAFPTIQETLLLQRGPARRTIGQPPFESTSRYFRGRIVEVLRTLPEQDPAGIDLRSLGPKIRDDFGEMDLPWLRDLVAGLQRDGLAVIAEETPRYDAAASDHDPEDRVRLP